VADDELPVIEQPIVAQDGRIVASVVGRDHRIKEASDAVTADLSRVGDHPAMTAGAENDEWFVHRARDYAEFTPIASVDRRRHCLRPLARAECAAIDRLNTKD